MRLGSPLLFLCAAVLAAAMTGPAEPGIVVDTQKMIQDLQRLNEELAELSRSPVYEEQSQVQAELQALVAALGEARASAEGDPDSAERIEQQIQDLEARLRKLSAQVAKLDEQRRALVDSRKLFPKTRNKVAVFAFEDPDGTGLSNSISLVIAKHMLFSTRVGSYAIVNFQSDLSSRGNDGLTYFDRVEKLTRNQGYTVAVWGRIRSAGNGAAQIDTFAQIPDDEAANRFERTLSVGTDDGNSVKLKASLRPKRFQIQSLTLSADAASQIQSAARELTKLRRTPAVSAATVHTLPEGQAFNITDSAGDWVELSLRGGKKGWTSVKAFCRGDCTKVLVTADLANDAVAFVEGNDPRRLSGDATREALAAYEQMVALNSLQRDPQRSRAIAARWLEPEAGSQVDQETGIDRGRARPPGGGAFANLRAIAEVAETAAAIDRERARKLVAELAAISVDDPGYGDVLHNLAGLFGYLGDVRRKEIAENIAATIAGSD
jgi:hypothetical protein